MKKIVLSVLPFFVFVLLSSNITAQTIIKVGAGYGLGTQKLLLENVTTLSGPENIYASFGGNAGFFLALGYELNQYIDFEFDFGYQQGDNKFIDSGLPSSSKTYIGHLLHFGPSLVFKTSVSENLSPYGKLGVFSGLPFTKEIIMGTENKFKGGFPFGYNGALGLDYNFADTFKIFAEVYSQSMVYKPTRLKKLDGSVIKFKDKLDLPTPNDQELSFNTFSFGALGLNIGVKIIL
ncbi:MAG: porin family protein [Prolixibacteraceae bacterium]|nr:porin family protein [Prolixibacteraceae bacterium]